MSTAFGNFTIGTLGKSSESGSVDGINNTEKRDIGTEGATNSIADFGNYTTFKPATERIPKIDDGNNTGGEPRRTKSGKIDRRTKAGRTETEAPGIVRPVGNAGKKLISLEKAILSLHDMAAGIFEIPEIMLSEDEAKALNDAVLDVSQYYVAAFDPKKVAIFNLVTCMGGIYATRIMAYRNRMELQRKGKLRAMPQPETVPPAAQPQPAEFQMNPPMYGAPGY